MNIKSQYIHLKESESHWVIILWLTTFKNSMELPDLVMFKWMKQQLRMLLVKKATQSFTFIPTPNECDLNRHCGETNQGIREKLQCDKMESTTQNSFYWSWN